MATWADVVARGLLVRPSADGVFYVSGDGFGIYVKEDDQETIDALANPPAEILAIEAPALTVSVPQLDPKTASLEDVIAVLNLLTA